MRSVFPKFLLLLVWTFVSFLKAQEADVKFEHLSIEEGLSQSLILDILQIIVATCGLQRVTV